MCYFIAFLPLKSHQIYLLHHLYTLLYSRCRYRCTHQFARSVFLTTLRFSSETFAYSLESGWSSVVPDPDQRVNGRITSPWSLKNPSVLRLLELTLVTGTSTGNNWTKNHRECNCSLPFFHPWVNTPCPDQWVSTTMDVTGSVLPKHEFSHAGAIWSCTCGNPHCIQSKGLNSDLPFRSYMNGNVTSQKCKVHHWLLKGSKNQCVLVLKGKITRRGR